MKNRRLLKYVRSKVREAGILSGGLWDENSGIHLLLRTTPTRQDVSVYRPLLCAVLQGAKEVGTSTRILTARAGQSLVVSHALPVVSRIIEATTEQPYVALVQPLDLSLLRSLAPSITPAQHTKPLDAFSICLSDTDPEMENALMRYFNQCETEEQRCLLAPITAREIHARLLMGPQAWMLQRLLRQDGTASRIFRATRDIQSDLTKPLVIGDLARCIGMSSSSFFEQFKAVTGTSPLQYQKDLRLLRARDELQTSESRVSKIALSVGYENPAQFSREYSRKFGKSPRQDRNHPIVD